MKSLRLRHAARGRMRAQAIHERSGPTKCKEQVRASTREEFTRALSKFRLGTELMRCLCHCSCQCGEGDGTRAVGGWRVRDVTTEHHAMVYTQMSRP